MFREAPGNASGDQDMKKIGLCSWQAVIVIIAIFAMLVAGWRFYRVTDARLALDRLALQIDADRKTRLKEIWLAIVEFRTVNGRDPSSLAELAGHREEWSRLAAPPLYSAHPYELNPVKEHAFGQRILIRDPGFDAPTPEMREVVRRAGVGPQQWPKAMLLSNGAVVDSP